MTGGTVFDIGYQGYDGERELVRRPRAAVFKDGVRIALGFGRGPRAKVLPWFFISLLAVIALIMALVAGAAERLAGPGAATELNLPSHVDFYGIASVIMFVLAALVAPELLCRDRREGVIQLYLVRPLSGGDYVAARWAAFLVVLLAAAWLPQTILFFGLAMGDPAPVAYVTKHWLDIPRYLLAGLAMAAYLTSLALLAASYTTRRAYASIFLVGVVAITAPFTNGLARELPGLTGQVISLFAFTNIPMHVNDIIFGDVGATTEGAPARELGNAVLVGWYFLWTLGPMAILHRRYRRLTP
jgi:ABC-2 type transport system permease protein